MSFKKINTENDIRPKDLHKILVYGYDKKERQVIIDIFAKANENTFMFVEKCFLDKKVEDLIYNDFINEIDSNSNKNFPDAKFMLLSGFSNKELNNLFSVFKSENVKRPVTAALTDHNKDWLLKYLIKDVYEEHLTMMNKMKKMQEQSAHS